MKVKELLREIEEIQVGYDVIKAVEKIDKINELLSVIENSLFLEICNLSREELISVFQHVYGISYEIGNTRQHVKSDMLNETAKRILPMAKLIFGKSKELLPYLVLNLNNSIKNKTLYKKLQEEIFEIENQ